MVSNSLSSTTTILRLIPSIHKPPPAPPIVLPTIKQNFLVGHRKMSNRGISVVTRAGISTTSYIFAFVFPLSLLAVTIFTSIKIADKLDQKFFEELAINQAVLENEDETIISADKEPAPIHTRNRPKREVEP